MANYQTITVDMDGLIKILNETHCGDCPCRDNCEYDSKVCAETILKELMPPKEYEFVFVIRKKVEAKNEADAAKEADKYLRRIAYNDFTVVATTWERFKQEE